MSNLIFVPGVNFEKRVTYESVYKTIEYVSKKFMFPNVEKMSTNSKTSRITRQYPKIMIKDQLYCLFATQATQVDQIIDELIDDGKLRLIDMNFENFKFSILITTAEFNNIIQNSFRGDEKIADEFTNVLEQDYQATQLTEDFLAGLNISLLISKGLICMTNDGNINMNIYNITLPHLGGLLRVVRSSSDWITSIINKNPQKMIKSDELMLKWTKPFFVNKSNFKREYYTTSRVGINTKSSEQESGPGINIVKFRGIGINWVLCVMIGTGALEKIDSSVGEFYKTTGKKI